ncbi:hypothetical protein ACFL08_04100 [Patescibacteria group bacterium]
MKEFFEKKIGFKEAILIFLFVPVVLMLAGVNNSRHEASAKVAVEREVVHVGHSPEEVFSDREWARDGKSDLAVSVNSDGISVLDSNGDGAVMLRSSQISSKAEAPKVTMKQWVVTVVSMFCLGLMALFIFKGPVPEEE